MVSREDERQRVQPITRGTDKSPGLVPQQREQQQGGAAVEQRERQTQQHAERNSGGRGRFEKEGLDGTDHRRMICQGTCLIVTNDAIFVDSSSMALPKTNIC